MKYLYAVTNKHLSSGFVCFILWVFFLNTLSCCYTAPWQVGSTECIQLVFMEKKITITNVLVLP